MSKPMSSEPILPGFYPDPTICRVEDDYYLVTSSFEYFPGAPIWNSRDLLTWNQIGHIFDRRSQFARGEGVPSTGLYAGTLRHHDGLFWYVTTNVGAEDGQIIVTATDPAGPWSDPVHVPEAVGIDPDLTWNDDGLCLLTWKALSFIEGDIGIFQAPIDPATGRLQAPAYPVWQGSGLAAAEGPHIYNIAGTWYLLLAEGGTERGHAATVARGPQPYGPFEPCPHNPILSHRSTSHPVQNIGHVDLVRTPDGQWAAVHLGARPRGSSPGFHVLGRETFIVGVDWLDGWPVIDESRYQTPPIPTAFVDDFGSAALDARWVVPGGEPEAITRPDTAGGLIIEPPQRGATAGHGGLLCTRVRDLRWFADATFRGSGRFLLRIDDRHHYGLLRRGSRVEATARIGDLGHVLATRSVSDGYPVTLRIEAVDPLTLPAPLGHAGPDDIVLSVLESGGAAQQLARLDGRYLSTEVASGFTGRMLAVAAVDEPAHLARVTYSPAGDRVSGFALAGGGYAVQAGNAGGRRGPGSR
jgi:xylan 1,4-beta-xylosidase